MFQAKATALGKAGRQEKSVSCLRNWNFGETGTWIECEGGGGDRSGQRVKQAPHHEGLSCICKEFSFCPEGSGKLLEKYLFA